MSPDNRWPESERSRERSWTAADPDGPSEIELAARAAAAQTGQVRPAVQLSAVPVAPAESPVDAASEVAAAPSSATVPGAAIRAAESSTATVKVAAATLGRAGTAQSGTVWAPSRIQIEVPPPATPPSADSPERRAVTHGRSWPSSRSGLARLRIGEHVCTREALEKLGASATVSELHLGLDQNGHPISTELFQGGGVRVTLVGGYWVAHLFAGRALVAGARLVVVTRDTARWHAFVTRAGGSANRVRVVPADQADHVMPALRGPTLLIDDAGALNREALPPSQAVLTVVPQVTASSALLMRGASLVALQSQAPYEADLAGHTLGLNTSSTTALGRLSPDMVAIFGEGIGSYVWTMPTPAEMSQFGPPTR